MKNILKETMLGITFWSIVIGFILIMHTIAELLSNIVTMDGIMTVVYIALGYSFIYLFKNL